MPGFDVDANGRSIMFANNVDFTGNSPTSGTPQVTANGQLLIGSSVSPNIRVNTLTAGTGISIANGSGTITISTAGATANNYVTDSGIATPAGGILNVVTAGSGTQAGITLGAGNTITVTPYNTAEWIVDPVANKGNQTTIQAAITAASSGDTIFIRPGTYTENLTLKAGVNLTAYECDSTTPNVTIIGTCTLTTAGTVSISGIRLQTNAAALLAVTGSAASIVNLLGCYLNMTNNTGITFSSSSSSARVNVYNSWGNLGTTGIAIFSHSSAGTMELNNVAFGNTGGSTTASTASAGILIANFTFFSNPVTTSGTNVMGMGWCNFAATNTTCLTVGGAVGNNCFNSQFVSGSASAISVGTGLSLTTSVINSSNTNAITGAGTISYADLSFFSSSNINTTTQALFPSGPSKSVGSTNSGNTNSLTVTNGSNTASSAANIISSVAGATAADPVHQSVVSGVTTWTWGIDNSVTSPTADPWVLSQGTALGTNNVMSVATSGEINYPLQPCFLGYLNAIASNVTGDGTNYTVAFNAEDFDQNSDFNTGTATFTAPVTGKYYLATELQLQGILSTHTFGFLNIVTTGKTFTVHQGNYFNEFGVATAQMGVGGSIVCTMTAGDTATVVLGVTGGTLVVDVAGAAAGSARISWFSGYLIC